MRQPDLSSVAPSERPTAAANHFMSLVTGMGTDKGAMSQAVMRSFHDTGKGTRIAKYNQQIQGVEVFNREFNVMLNDEMSLVATSGYFARNLIPQGQIAPDTNFGDVNQAIKFAVASASEGQMNIELESFEQKGQYQVFNASVQSDTVALGSKPRAKKFILMETMA
ncbi:hypothetical protein [Glaciecola sp. KUL10]|uniref:hypothetical protein n=1 Tax=Glaciecola sp. (strain KUL10) TaxID=2161813 RepID=UPI000D788271|nr:hypothetical protein [Glaciecola sp. KUL10]GBL05140.1 protease-associated PA domain protein [Glaciecola sp. KUL10]